MRSNNLENLAQPPAALLVPSPSTALRSGVRTRVEFTGLLRPEIDSANGRETKGRKAAFLIATRTYSRGNLTHRKNRLIRFSNRHKIHLSQPGFSAHGSQSPDRQPGRPLLIANRGRGELTNVATR
jgi:hypothetical protein